MTKIRLGGFEAKSLEGSVAGEATPPDVRKACRARRTRSTHGNSAGQGAGNIYAMAPSRNHARMANSHSTQAPTGTTRVNCRHIQHLRSSSSFRSGGAGGFLTAHPTALARKKAESATKSSTKGSSRATPGRLRRSQNSGTLSLQQSVAAAYETGVPPPGSIHTGPSAAYGRPLAQPQGVHKTRKSIPTLAESTHHRRRRHHYSTNSATRLAQPAQPVLTQTQHHFLPSSGMTNPEAEQQPAQLLGEATAPSLPPAISTTDLVAGAVAPNGKPRS